nr:MFS transporter [Actinomycetales bacterium]
MPEKSPDPERLLRRRVYRGMSLEEAQAAEAAHRKRMAVLLALFMTQFFGMLSNTIIGNSMPVIVAEIGGNQGQYAWIMTSGILANTITTPIAGKLADLLNKKLLYMLGIGIFMVGSLLSGFAWSPESLIAFRVLQGIGMGIQVTLSQVILASVVPPRERGRYNGIMGAIFAVATVSGPLIGGLIVDVPFLGWRWTFWIVIPFMAIALYTVHRRLQMTRDLSRKVSVDYLGALFISTGAAV